MIDTNILAGSGLDTLEENRDWNDIYDMEWGSFDDLFQGFGSLGGMSGML